MRERHSSTVPKTLKTRSAQIIPHFRASTTKEESGFELNAPLDPSYEANDETEQRWFNEHASGMQKYASIIYKTVLKTKDRLHFSRLSTSGCTPWYCAWVMNPQVACNLQCSRIKNPNNKKDAMGDVLVTNRTEIPCCPLLIPTNRSKAHGLQKAHGLVVTIKDDPLYLTNPTAPH